MSDSKPPLPTIDTLDVRNGGLSKSEAFWLDHYSWLKTNGFSLRDRYSPGWIPTWIRSPHPDKPWYRSGDSVMSISSRVMDAKRLDGSLVALKVIDIIKFRNEIEIGKLFTESFKTHPDNRCVPFLDIISVPDKENTSIIVMPLLYDNDFHPFHTIGEVVDFFRQLFKGLRFMHQNHVAHRDIKIDNILADVLPLYNVPPHPWKFQQRYDFKGEPRMTSSRTRTPIRYYILDFGLSRRYPENGPFLEHPWFPGDKTVPEFQDNDESKLCDPFAVDVYCLGNFIREKFTKGDKDLRRLGKKGFEFMHGLVADMVQDDPKLRPTMEQVVTRFEDIVKNLSQWKLRAPVVEMDDDSSKFERVIHSAIHWLKQINNVVRRIPAVPLMRSQ